MPNHQDEEIVHAIASAPSSIVRIVLRALCADEETKLHDMEIDFDSDFWADCGEEYDDTPFWREQNPDGFTIPCCGETGSSVDEGCTMGKHRAADGKRGRYEYSKNPNRMAAALEAELRAKERTGNLFL
ncbi:hypothetical protein QBC32DRAFT_318693 [Pseudoneurospora amorphoporcata]|uniref:Uncharacterized protein n=1 Tax=Pseudoneurospora amorphoporcata TaxID=241081 RepID=A0AAN6SC60_9PEZI|nr:hypothetical protein QBC32DRAFT_318693 [Pseudoneurospora amorphoporcata]